MTREQALELIKRAAREAVARQVEGGVSDAELFGVHRRMLERGVERLDAIAGAIVAEEHHGLTEYKAALEALLASMAQIGCAAVLMLETTPFPDHILDGAVLTAVGGRGKN